MLHEAKALYQCGQNCGSYVNQIQSTATYRKTETSHNSLLVIRLFSHSKQETFHTNDTIHMFGKL